jgi:hypothetical protein
MIHLRSQNGKMKLSGREVRLFAAYIDARSRRYVDTLVFFLPLKNWMRDLQIGA